MFNAKWEKVDTVLQIVK